MVDKKYNNGCGVDDGRGIAMEIISGKPFYPLDAKVDEINVRDIAHSLSHICRYNGHCRVPYYVAHHSVILSYVVGQNKSQQFDALMHDGTEAYLGDMIRPLKLKNKDFNKSESNLWLVIADRFGLSNVLSENIKREDTKICFTERRDLLNHTGECEWGLEMMPHKFKIKPWLAKKSKRIFLRRFNELCRPHDKVQFNDNILFKCIDYFSVKGYK